jgi:hypothetical protein
MATKTVDCVPKKKSRTLIVNEKLLRLCVQQVEEESTFTAPSNMFEAVAARYNSGIRMTGGKEISGATAGNRIKLFKIPFKTVRVPLTEEQKAESRRRLSDLRKKNGQRPSQAERLKSHPDFKAHIAELRVIFPEQYQSLLDRYEKNPSRGMGVKIKCLDCVSCQKEEIKNCTSLGCGNYMFRPFQGKIKASPEGMEEAEESDDDEEDEDDDDTDEGDE